jgi:hypothetical protein
MATYRNTGQKTLTGIMSLIILFLIADVVVFVLMYFNIDIGGKNNQFSDNSVFNNLTDNSVTKTPLLTVTQSVKTDNASK